VLPETRLATTLQFIYANDKREEPEMLALLDVIGDVWRGNPTSQNAANDPAARARRA
jgi:hypothetical protein